MKARRIARTLGKIFQAYSAFFLLPFIGAFIWDEDVPTLAGIPVTAVIFGISALLVFFLGLVLSTLAAEAEEDLREREAFFIVAAGWFMCAILGALPFLLYNPQWDPTVALFESMSGITTTGFTALSGALESYPASIHVWRGTQNFFGGIGIILILVAITGRLTEGAVKLLSTEAGSVTRLRPKLSQSAKSLFSVYLSLNLVVFLLFLFAMHFTGERHSWRMASFHALVHSFAAVATGGFSTRSLSVEAFDSAFVDAVAFVAMFAGAISFVLIYQAVTGLGLRHILRNPEFRFFVATILLASIAIGLFLVEDGRGLAYAVKYGPWTVVTTIATCGFTNTNVDLFPDGAKLVLLLLMMTGGMVGSTAGAIKIGRIQTLFSLTLREMQKLLHPHSVAIVKVGGRLIPEESMRRIVVFFFTYVTVFIAGAMAFAGLGFTLDTSLVASASSLGGVGYGWSGVFNGFGDTVPWAARLVGTALMWLGRLEIFAVLLVFAPATYRD